MGKHGFGGKNKNLHFFPHKDIHKKIWTSPDGKTENQIDHITISRKWCRNLRDVRVKRVADAASVHHLVQATLKLKRKTHRDRAQRPSFKYNIKSLKKKPGKTWDISAA